jgi:peptidyl-tRNA hydrolase, PTH2 family
MKQVIVLRKDLNMRKGKMIAQGAHASLSAYLIADEKQQDAWWDQGQTKICVGVDTEAELHEIWRKAAGAGLPTYIVRDAGRTEFKGPTYTAVAIGPADSSEIDKITGSLKLL